jgi:hypothetical protein
MDKYNKRNIQIEPFFDLILKALKKVFIAIIKGVCQPVIAIMRRIARIIVDFIANTILRPIFRPIGQALKILVLPFKPIFAFIGKILDFIVSIIKFIATVIDMILSLPFRILGGIGLITYPDPPDPRLTNLSDLKAITKMSNVVGNINSTLTDSAKDAGKVINKPNMIIFFTILTLSLIFLMMYFFYEQFGDLVNGILGFFLKLLYGSSSNKPMDEE